MGNGAVERYQPKIRLLCTNYFPLLLVLITFFVSLWPAVNSVVARWDNTTEAYSHGWLLLAVSLFLTVRQLRRHTPVPMIQYGWLAILFGMTAAFAAAQWIDLQVVQHILLIPMLLTVLLSFWGWRQTRPFFIPIGVMLMAVPFWDFLNWPLQLITVAVNSFVFGLMGVHFTVNGVYVHFINVGTFEVAGGCSGLRYLIVAIAVCLIFGHVSFEKASTRMKFVLMGALVGIVTNWFRVFVVFYVGYSTKMQSGLVHNHDLFGWILFGIVLIPLFWFGGRMQAAEKVAGDSSPRLPARQTPALSRLILFGGCTIIILLLPLAARISQSTEGNHLGLSYQLDIPNNWQPLFGAQAGGWSPNMKGADVVYRKRWFRVEGDGADSSVRQNVNYINAYAATYIKPQPGKKLIQYGNNIYDRSQWFPEETFKVPLNNTELNGLVLKERDSQKRLYLAYGYYVGGQWARNRVQAKLNRLSGILKGRNDASIFAVAIDCKGRCDSRELLLQSTRDLVPQFEAEINNVMSQ